MKLVNKFVAYLNLELLFKIEKRINSIKCDSTEVGFWFIAYENLRLIAKEILAKYESQIFGFINHSIHDQFMASDRKIELVKYSVIGKFYKGQVLIDSADPAREEPYLQTPNRDSQFIIMEGSVVIIITNKTAAPGRDDQNCTGLEEDSFSESDSCDTPEGSDLESTVTSLDELSVNSVTAICETGAPKTKTVIKLEKNQIFSSAELTSILGIYKDYKVIVKTRLKAAVIPNQFFDTMVKNPKIFYASNLVRKVLSSQLELKNYLNDKFINLVNVVEYKVAKKDEILAEFDSEISEFFIPLNGEVRVIYRQQDHESQSRSHHNSVSNKNSEVQPIGSAVRQPGGASGSFNKNFGSAFMRSSSNAMFRSPSPYYKDQGQKANGISKFAPEKFKSKFAPEKFKNFSELTTIQCSSAREVKIPSDENSQRASPGQNL